MIILFCSLAYIEWNNCIMYISQGVTFSNMCVLICYVPFFTSTMAEIQFISFVLLIKERLKIMNHLIIEYKIKLNLKTATFHDHKQSDIYAIKYDLIRKKVFFISEFGQKNKHNLVNQTKCCGIITKPNLNLLLNPVQSFWHFIKNLCNFRKTRIFNVNFQQLSTNIYCKRESNLVDNHNNNLNYCIARLTDMQIIYSKLFKITELINKSYGIQLCFIILVYFITLTTLLYYCCMKIIRFVIIQFIMKKIYKNKKSIWSKL